MAGGKGEYIIIPLFLTLRGVFGGVGRLKDCTDSLVGTLTMGTGGSGASGPGDWFLPLENFRAWPRLPLLRRRLANDIFRSTAGSPACPTGVSGRELGGNVDVVASVLILL